MAEQLIEVKPISDRKRSPSQDHVTVMDDTFVNIYKIIVKRLCYLVLRNT